MSIVDKVIAAIIPPETQQARIDARAKAESLATPGSWLEMVLRHHQLIEGAFEDVARAGTASDRRIAQRKLGALLTGHSMAEEGVIYPAMALHHEKGHAEMAFIEQSAAKVQLAGLEELDPESQDFIDKFGHLRGAVLHHIYEEESSRFPDLLDRGDAALHSRIAMRYHEEFSKYMGTDMASKTLASAAVAPAGVDSGLQNAEVENGELTRATNNGPAHDGTRTAAGSNYGDYAPPDSLRSAG